MLWFFLCIIVSCGYAQVPEHPFQHGEELKYEIKYKYGLVMIKAGSANYQVQSAVYNRQAAYESILTFKTYSFFDKFYKIRDTLTSYISVPKLIPLYNGRSVNEGDTHYLEKLFINKYGENYTEVHVIREKSTIVKVDTVLSVNNMGYDLLNIFMYVRALNYEQLTPGIALSTTTFLGESKVNIIIRYQGASILDRGSNVKYKALKFNIDIADKTFNESKNSMEIWISDDNNRVPLRLKAKLKIGAAEADLISYKNLKHPFEAEIKTKTSK
ncbi:MAG: DUF3108 domain-containing protein [Dysgonamonadaceae bacterium]|jgi:hypothetical protein|nr:DUF3108 domain-containing protein [Dysgonamonadaceae bacterium]